ncbi:MAG: hypothetical protein U0X76_00605 [Bacteroidia bacterium]
MRSSCALSLFFCTKLSIRPNNTYTGTTLTTHYTPSGLMMNGSPPQGASDIYLQQGSNIIYTNSFDPMAQIYSGLPFYFWSDSLFTDFTIANNAVPGWYDVHVISYDHDPNDPWWPATPIDNVLTSGFLVALPGVARSFKYFCHFHHRHFCTNQLVLFRYLQTPSASDIKQQHQDIFIRMLMVKVVQ